MTKNQKLTLVALRLAIGWHFLYEGLVKLTNPNWSSVSYLLDSEGFLRQLYIGMASNPDILKAIDFLNIWGLIFIGLGLILGAFSRVAIISGIVLMVFYYLSHPPFVGLKYAVPGDGSYLVVNKMVIEALALGVLLVFPTWMEWGLDRWIWRRAKGICSVKC